MTTSYHETPSGLDVAGERLWRDITETFDFTDEPAKLAILERAAKTADQIARLEAAAAEQPLTAKGSMGQLVIHPLVAEIRQQGAALDQLLKSLKLPETDEETAERAARRSRAGRIGANARHGKPAR